MRKPIGQLLVAMAVAFGIAGCGGGGGGGGGNSFTGIDRLGVSSGTITGFGSIFVNGVEWRTSGAGIEVGDQPGTEADLRLGQVVVVRGTLDAGGKSGRAERVAVDSEVEGPVAAIDSAAGTFVVLGQTVRVVTATVFDTSIAGGLAGLLVGDGVEVSGYRDSAGVIRATRIERQDPGDDAGVKGRISGLDTGNQRFMIGSLVVDYAGATLKDFGGAAPANGDLVEVDGSYSGGVLHATTVDLEKDPYGSPGTDTEIEIEGYVTQVFSASEFEVAGQRVMTNAGTEFEGGTAADLVVDAKLEVEGRFNAAGVLVAEEIDFRVSDDDGNVEVAGVVRAIDAQQGTLQIEGVLVRTNAATIWKDDSAAGLLAFGLADLNVGDYVEVCGGEDPSPQANDMLAVCVQREDQDDEASLRGPIQSIAQPDITVLGITIGTDTAVFRDPNDNPMSAAVFFAAIAVGDVIEATTDSLAGFNGNTFIAEEVEMEDDD